MEESRPVNSVLLRGVLHEPPAFSHESRGEAFYRFSLDIARLSGAIDTVNVLAKRQLLEHISPDGEEKLCVVGELRSFNNKSGVGPRLVISVYARELRLGEGEDENTVELTGSLCKAPNLRVTPMGREICDMMLAVNRRYGRSDYLPCIAWGVRAREASDWGVGTGIHITGRLQSRTYTKLVNGEPQDKVAFEVSVISAERTESPGSGSER